MAITASGSAVSSSGTAGQTSLSGITNAAIGNCLILYTLIYDNGTTVSSVSGTKTGTWAKLTSNFDTTLTVNGVRYGHEIWLGTTTATGSETLTIAYSAAIGTINVDMVCQQFTNGNTATSWTVDGTHVGSNDLNNGGTTSITYPTLTPSTSGVLYVGAARVSYAGHYSGTYGGPTGFTAQIDATTKNPFIYGVVSSASTPIETATIGTDWYTTAALVNAHIGSDTNTATLADTGGVTAATLSSADTSPLTDTSLLAVATPSADPRALSDTSTILAAVPGSDTSPLADTGALTAVTTTSTDPRALSDTSTTVASVPGADTSTLANSSSLAIATANADSGALADAATVSATVTDADATGHMSVLVGVAPGVTDTASQAETGSLGVTLSSADSGSQNETLSLAPRVADTTGLADTGSIAVSGAGLSDTAALVDTGSLTVAVPDGDSGTQGDTFSLVVLDTDTTGLDETVEIDDAYQDTSALSEDSALAVTSSDTDSDLLLVDDGAVVFADADVTGLDDEGLLNGIADPDTSSLADTTDPVVAAVADADTTRLATEVIRVTVTDFECQDFSALTATVSALYTATIVTPVAYGATAAKRNYAATVKAVGYAARASNCGR